METRSRTSFLKNLIFLCGNFNASAWFEVIEVNSNLRSLLARGIPNNPNLKSAIWNWRYSKDNLYIAKGGYLPAVKINSTLNSTLKNFENEFYDWQTRLIFSYNLVDGGITKVNKLIAKKSLLITKNQIAKKFQEILQEIFLLWVEYKIALKKNLAYQKILSNLEKDYEVSRNRFHQGQVSALDVQNAFSVLENYKMKLIQSQNDIKILQIKIEAILGMPFPHTFEAINFNLKKFAQFSFKDFFNFALINNIDLIIARDFQALARLNIELELAKAKPKIAFNFGPQVSVSRNDNFQVSWSNFSLNFDYDLYNSGTTSNHIRQKYSDLAQSNIEHSKRILKINEEILTVLNSVTSDLRAMAKADESLLALEKVLKAARMKYETGSESMLVVLEQEEKWLEQYLVILEIEKDIERNIVNLVFFSGKIDLAAFGWQHMLNCLDVDFFNNAGALDFKDIDTTNKLHQLGV